MTPCLLIDERPLVILPKLAQAIGLNEAIVLQQIHWLCNSREIGVDREGKRWIYNTPEGWRYWFPFFSKNTIRRTVDALREMNLLTCKQLEGGQRPMFFRLSDSAPVLLKRMSLDLPEPSDEPELGKNATLHAQSGQPEHAQNGQGSVPKLGNKREVLTRTPNESNSDFAEFNKRWCEDFASCNGETYKFNGVADAQATKALLKTGLDIGTLLEMASKAWSRPDAFNCRQAITIKGFNSRFNEIRAELKNANGNRQPATSIRENIKCPSTEFHE